MAYPRGVTWLTPDPGEHPAKRLRGMLDEPGAIAVPGVFDGLTALLAKDAGAQVLAVSGAAFPTSMGMPDIGLVTLDELARAVRQIVRVTRLPLLVDAGSGFGSPLMVMRTVRELEGARCAAIHLVDRHEEAEIAEPEGFAERVRAAATARQQLVVVARTEAGPLHGFDEAVRRGLAYREAGADVICPGSLRTGDELAAFAREVPGPLLADAEALAPGADLGVERLGELGYRLALFPLSAALVAAAQARAFYGDLLRDGTRGPWLERMLRRDRLDVLVGRADHADLDRGLASGPSASEDPA